MRISLPDQPGAGSRPAAEEAPSSRPASGRQPLVTVVMATRNRPKLLKVAMASVINQTYPNWELVLVNDGGEDVRALVEEARDPRIRYFRLPENRGAAHAYNYALFESKGEYIAYLADDDLYYPNHLQVLVDVLEANPSVGGAYSQQYEVKCTIENGEYTAIHEKLIRFHHDWLKVNLIAFGNFIPQPCLVHRRSLLAKAGMFDESLSVLIDFDLFRRMAFYTDFMHVQVVTGEYFFPVNKKERITDLQYTDPSRYQACTAKAFSKVPDRPWDRLETLNILIHCRRVAMPTLNQLKYIFGAICYPIKVHLFLDGYDRDSTALLKQLEGIPFRTVLNLDPCGLEGAVRKFLGCHMQGENGWLTLLDETAAADLDWRIKLFEQVQQHLEGRFRQEGTVRAGCLYTDPAALFPDR